MPCESWMRHKAMQDTQAMNLQKAEQAARNPVNKNNERHQTEKQAPPPAASMKDMAAEYLQNALQMEARIQQLEEQAKAARQLEVRRKLRKRINALHVMVCESRQIAFELEHYYDKPEEKAHVTTSKPRRGRPKKKYSRYGQGTPTPALVMRGGNVNKRTVSGLRSTLSGGNAAKGNCK